MDSPIEDGIGQRGLPQGVMPVGHQEWTGHQWGAPAGALIKALQEIAALLGGARGHPPSIHPQHRDCGDLRQHLDIPALALGAG
jgi:hypothetical protein